jgi:hypothetical protein
MAMRGKFGGLFWLATMMIIALPIGARPVSAKPVAIAAADAAGINAHIRAVYSAFLNPPLAEGARDPNGWVNGPDGTTRYASRTEALIAEWKRLSDPDEVTALSDFGWECQCQDWDDKTAKLWPATLSAAPGGRIDARFRFSAGWKDVDTMHFRYIKEGGKWLPEDIFFTGGGQLTQMLRQEIAEAKTAKAHKKAK